MVTKGKTKKSKSSADKTSSSKKRAAVRSTAKAKRAPHKAPADAADRSAITRAILRHVRLAPQKARLIVNMIKGKQVEPALQILKFSPKKGARLTYKLLRSAIADAKERSGVDVDNLWVTGGWVDMGRTLKRYMPRARGSAYTIRKRSCHITLVLGER